MTAIRREERIGGQRLILGDCLEVLPELGKIDAVISDPPYGTDPDEAGYGRSSRGIANDRNLDFVDRVLRALGMAQIDCWYALFHSPRNAPDFYAITQWMMFRAGLVWNKKAPGMGAPVRYQHELVSVFSTGNPAPMQPLFSIITHYRDAQLHPHQKPVGLMAEIVSSFDGHVLDPFMGSGSTLVACERLGRHGTGIEIDPDYFEICCRRVEDETRRPDLFVADAPQPQQLNLIGDGE